MRHRDQFIDGAFNGMTRAAGDTFIHQCRNGDLPALIQFADQIFSRHPHVVVEDFVEIGIAGDLYERTNGNTGRLHIDQQIRDAAMLRCIGISAHQQHLHVGALRETRPHFLTIDNKIITIDDRARLQSRQVRACPGSE